MAHIAIIADDLTGANDTGVQFAKCGFRTHVVIRSNSAQTLPAHADVIVINTDSRSLPAKEAYQRVAHSAQLIKDSHIPVIYKKIDSTLRGNLGVEIDSVLDVFDFDCAVVAPAFPRNGRITVGGYHLLNQIPLQLTELAQDPRAPVTDSRLAALLKTQSRFKVGYVALSDVLLGSDRIIQCLEESLTQGEKLITFDATDEVHLGNITEAMRKSGRNVLWVGSAGLAEFLPELYPLPSGQHTYLPSPGGLPVLVVAGSVSSITAAQIAAFLAMPNTGLVAVNGKDIVENATAEVQRCIALAGCHLRCRRNIAIVSSSGHDSVEAAHAAGEQLGIGASAVSDQIAEMLGEIVKAIVDIGVEGIFLTGGDTAIRVCTALGAVSMEVCSEVAPGIPFCRLNSGPYSGLKVVTKAGAFGDEQAITRAVSVIQTM